jgi:hypothetical protein
MQVRFTLKPLKCLTGGVGSNACKNEPYGAYVRREASWKYAMELMLFWS